MKYLIAVITFFWLTTNPVMAQSSDSTTITTTTIRSDTTKAASADPYEGTDDFSPGLAFFALLGIGFVLVCVGAGITLTVIWLFLMAGMISFGILSASVLVGINKKSFTSGFKVFLIATSTTGGLLLTSFAFWMLNKVLHWYTPQAALIIGAILGLLAGLTFGLIVFYILQRLTTYLRARLKLV